MSQNVHRRSTRPVACLLLFGVACLGACGGGGPGVIDVPRPTLVTGLSPTQIDTVATVSLVVTGTELGNTGDLVTLRFRAHTGAPFGGGLLDVLDVPGVLVSATRAEATLPPLTAFVPPVGNFADTDFSLVLTNGVERTPASGIVARFGQPALAGIEPSEVRANVVGPTFIITGSHFGTPGTEAELWLDFPWRPVARGSGNVLSSTEIRARFPPVRVTEVRESDRIAAAWPDVTSVATLEGAGLVRFHPPVLLSAPAPQVPDGQQGAAVAISDDLAVVGAPGSPRGEVHVFHRSGTTWTWELSVGTAPGVSNGLGRAVAVDGDTVLVGDDFANGSAGQVLVWRRQNGTWSQTQTLVASDGEANDAFGAAVAIAGDYAVVGAPGYDRQGSDTGTVYVFQRIAGSWEEQTNVYPTEFAAWQRFGSALAMDGETFIVGAPTNGETGNTGAAHIFRRSGAAWPEQVRLLPFPHFTLVSNGVGFGTAVALGGGRAAVGSPIDAPEVSPIPGVVYQFRQDDSDGAWYAGGSWHAPQGETQGAFGIAVAVNEDTLVVSSTSNAYHYRWQGGITWTLERALQGGGGGVALSNLAALVGAPSSGAWVH